MQSKMARPIFTFLFTFDEFDEECDKPLLAKNLCSVSSVVPRTRDIFDAGPPWPLSPPLWGRFLFCSPLPPKLILNGAIDGVLELFPWEQETGVPPGGGGSLILSLSPDEVVEVVEDGVSICGVVAVYAIGPVGVKEADVSWLKIPADELASAFGSWLWDL